jgi:methyl-accepting chemotaxis protein
MNRISYPRKFMLVGLLMLLPLLYVMIQYIGSINYLIDFGAKEQDGLIYSSPAVDFLENVQRHAILSQAYLNGVDSTAEELATIQSLVDEDIRAIDAVNAELGTIFEVNQRWADIKRSWQTLRDGLPNLTPQESADLHEDIAQQMLRLLVVVGNNSNLILDPDIDSYYLMDLLIVKLPPISEYLSQIRTLGTEIAVQNQMTVEQRNQLSILIGLTQSAIDAMLGFGTC